MQKVKNYLLIILAGFLIASVISGNVLLKKYKAEKIETARLLHNYKVKSDSMLFVEGQNKLLSNRLESESLTVSEMKKYYSNIVNDITDMKIQLRKISGITAFNTETTNNINTFFKDSIRVDSVKIQTLSYSDRWIDIQIVKEGLKTNINSITRDSLIQVVHWDRVGKFWPTRFLTKKTFYQDIKSMNPGTRIKYSKWIIPIKK